MDVLPASISVYHMYSWYFQGPEDEVGYTDGCEPAHGCWELNRAPLEEQPELLTPEPSLHSHSPSICYVVGGGREDCGVPVVVLVRELRRSSSAPSALSTEPSCQPDYVL